MQYTKEKITKLEYILVALLILISGSPVLVNTTTLYAVTGIISIIYTIHNRLLIKREGLTKYLILTITIFFAQYIVFGQVTPLGYINYIGKILTAVVVMWILKERFRTAYLNCMYFFAIISLILFSYEFLSGTKVPNLFYTTETRHSILIYCSDMYSSRNAGPFWEPGAFACYLTLIPLLFIDNLSAFVKNNKKKCIVLFLALITTYSTTGYICIALVITYYYLSNKNNRFATFIIYLPIVAVIFVYSFTELDFIGEKIKEQYQNAVDLDGEFHNSRFGALMFDMHYIEKHPIIGNGFIDETRYADHPHLWGKKLGHGNGFSNYTVQVGILIVIAYLMLLYKGFNKNMFVPLVVLLLLQGEQLMNFPIFLGLPFILLPNNNSKRKKDEEYSHNTDSV